MIQGGLLVMKGDFYIKMDTDRYTPSLANDCDNSASGLKLVEIKMSHYGSLVTMKGVIKGSPQVSYSVRAISRQHTGLVAAQLSTFPATKSSPIIDCSSVTW